MSVVSLPDAKAYLRIITTDHDAALPGFIDAAEALIAKRIGPLEATSRTDRVEGRTDALVLHQTPAISLTSVTPVNGSPVDLSGLYADLRAGLVTALHGGFPAPAYDVVYEAGRASVPDDLVLAIKELLRHLWDSQRGPGGSPGAGDPMAPAPAAYLIPWRVAELIAPYLQAGVA